MNKSEIGALGEKTAENYLIRQNYRILERNWRYSRAEIDIIAIQDDILVFIEVKTRSSTYFGAPEDSVDSKKEALIMDAAQRYMEEIDHTWEIRFDIVSILLDKSLKVIKIEHFEDAFFY